jgi:methionine-rich copper-binding protein CopC
VPQTEIVISSAQQTVAGSSITNSAVFQVQGLESSATWEYSLDGGTTWFAGSGNSIALSAGSYAANAIQVRQTDAAGNLSTGVGHYGSALVIDTIAPGVSTFAPSDDAANVDIASNIALVFNESVRRGTGSIVLKAADGTVVATYDAATSANLSISGNTLTINPSADLDYGTGYVVEFAAGSIKDLAGNSYAGTTTYNFTTGAQPIAGQVITGGDGPDSLVGTVGNDTVAGGAGIDIYTFTGNRSQYILTKTANGYQAHDGTPGRDGTDLISAVETLAFADSTVDLTMAQRAAAISTADLKTLEELYVGFFNRIPEAAGLRYWIGEVESGVSLRAVADQFYSAGVQFGVYSESMTEAEFILAIYANVLGRSGATAPPQEDIEYWQGWLHTGTNSKGAMVLEMLSNSHEFFTGDPEVGWVIDLLDNKAEVANYFAVQQGLSYSDPLTNIARGIEIAAEITPTDTSAAIALIGVNEFSM